ncbi:MAG TPA: DUF4127 family protein, partial [Clostridia bacterium]
NLNNSLSTDSIQIPFTEAIREWGYVSNKQSEGYQLTSWENDFRNNFEDAYIINAPSDFKYKDTPLPLVHKKLFEDASELMKKIIDLVAVGKIDEYILSVDDFNVPGFIYNMQSESWVPKDENQQPLKFSWSRTYLNTGTTSVMKHHKEKFGESDLYQSENGMGEKINYIYGTDEIPQMIYSRDLTFRTHFATKFEDPLYSSSVNSLFSYNDITSYIGYYDVVSVKKALEQRLAFVTRKEGSTNYQNGVICPNDQRKFQLFVHNSDISKDGIKNLLDTENAKTFARDVYSAYNEGKNVGVIDIKTNSVDYNLFEALSLINDSSTMYQAGYEKNSIAQLGCYSGLGTVGNSTGLGIAHAQVFGVIDYFNDTNKNLKSKIAWHSKLLAKHFIEDAMYNTKIKTAFHGDIASLRSELLPICQSPLIYYNSDTLKPGGDYWLMKFYRNPNAKMRLNKLSYYYTAADVISATTPWWRDFECLMDMNFSNKNMKAFK